MREHEYKARDKTVNKMSRDGLVEENLQKKDSVRVSRRELDDLTLPGQAADSMNFQKGAADSNRHGHRDNISTDAGNPTKSGRWQRQSAKRRQLYETQAKNIVSEPAGDPVFGLPVQLSPENHTDSVQGPDSGGDAETEVPGAGSDSRLAEHSSRMGSIRGHPSNSKNYAEAVVETSHIRKKKLVQPQFRKVDGQQEGDTDGSRDSGKKDVRYRETSGDAGETLNSARENIKKKQKREQIHKEQKKQASRLSFGDDENSMVHGAGMGISKKAASAASHSMSAYAHGKVHEAEQENSAAEGAHRAEVMAEHSLRYAMRSSRRMVQRKLSRWQESPAEAGVKSRLQFESAQETAESVGKRLGEAEQAEKIIRKKFWQKQRIKKSYQAAKRGEKTTAEAAKATQSVFDKIKSKAASVLKNNKGIFGAAAVIGLLFLMLSAGLSSCSAMVEGASSSIIGTTYPSTDEDIYDTENAYAALEAALNRQVNNMESTHPGYDEYWYQVDEISHNPYHLISYFTAKYGEFTYGQVKDEVEEIFREQYSLHVDEVNDTVTETKTVRVGESLGQVVTSGYCNCSICCGVWSGGPTASGAYPTANHTIAVDAANPFVPMGTKVVMNGVEYVVEDTGAFARYGVQFDIYYDSHSAASAHGHKTWEAFIADDNGSREVEVTTTEVINRLEVTLTNHNLDTVLRSRMDENEEKRYDLYNGTYGNRNYLFDVGSLPGGSGADGYGYEIPSEALSDEKFAKMIHEAEKYLGRPYVWGGASPSTGFDCSGFVSWVINNCGNGWNVGRQTAEGLCGCCAYVPPAQAKPGDLIFFQNTYPTSGASHVGIYVGNNMMLHCGDPIQYTNISSSYWQQHLLGFGRLP
ncbi:hydrolase [Clostridiaceae bacterium]|nr:hydrolase [Clostridiaceae bacterium]